MSNPGVIKLAENNIGLYSLRIEDNIGEAIHIHWGSIRIDLSIKEFCGLRNKLVSIIECMMNAENFSYDDYDPIFLLQASNILMRVNHVSTEKILVKELLTNNYDKCGKMSLVHISESRVCEAVRGNYEQIKNWKQVNSDNMDNIERFKRLRQSIMEEGFQDNRGSSIVLCDGGRYIYDGCHRASILYMDNPNKEIEIKMWNTYDKSETDKNILNYMDMYNQNIDNILKERDRWITNTSNLVKYYLESNLKGKRVIFKGAGKHTRKLIELVDWEKNEIKLVGVLTNDMSASSTTLLPILDKKNLDDNVADAIIISSYKFRQEMRDELSAWSNKYEIIDIYDECADGEFFSGTSYSHQYPWRNRCVQD